MSIHIGNMPLIEDQMSQKGKVENVYGVEYIFLH